MPSLGRGEPAIVNGPKSKLYVRIGGQPDADERVAETPPFQRRHARVRG